jgi:hypothetical protein
MDKSRTLGANKKLAFSSSDSDGPTNEHSCDENHDTSNPRTNGKKLHEVEKKKPVKKSQKRVVSPVRQIIVKKTPKTVGQTKIKSRVDKQVSKFCSPVLTFLASLSGTCTVSVAAGCRGTAKSVRAFHMHQETQKLLTVSICGRLWPECLVF